LIRQAARRAPGDLAGRLEEEWLADLAARPSAWSRVSFALGCCWATQVIAREHAVSHAALAGHAAGPRLAIPYEDFSRVSRRSGTFMLVLGLHIAIFCGLMIGVDTKFHKITAPDLVNRPLPEPHPSALPPLPPPPTITQTRIDRIDVEFPPIAPGDDGAVTTVREPPIGSTQPPEPPHVVNRVQGGPGRGFPDPDEFYPSPSRWLNEQGLSVVQVCVDPSGRLISDPTTKESSGSSRLDAGALKLAKAGSGHYRATTEDGRPVTACYPLRVRFQLKN
jgi:TonB family protein